MLAEDLLLAMGGESQGRSVREPGGHAGLRAAFLLHVLYTSSHLILKRPPYKQLETPFYR